MFSQGQLITDIEIHDGETIHSGTTVYRDRDRLECWIPGHGFVFVEKDEVEWESDRND